MNYFYKTGEEIKPGDKVEIPGMYDDGLIVNITDDGVSIFWDGDTNAMPTGDDLQETYDRDLITYLVETGLRKKEDKNGL